MTSDIEIDLTLRRAFKTGVNPVKLFVAVIYRFSLKARVFVPGKPFKPSQMFAGKARAYPLVEHMKGKKFYRIGTRAQCYKTFSSMINKL